jgi:dTDP-4-amino-4,6-dideoxygalactose transaminase
VKQPAVLGGAAAFPDGLPIARPAVPPLDAVVDRYRPSHEAGVLTNGPLVRELETQVCERLDVRNVVAVSSCTAGLLLTLRLSGHGPVVLPSFTFSASAHAVAWNGRPTRFVECDPDSFQVDVESVERAIDGAGTILATHVFGAPCDATRLSGLAASAGVGLVFDAAHALGASHQGRAIGGWGVAEIFSLSPTKPVVAGEGGLVATNDDDLAAGLRIGRDYGNPGDYNTRFVGLNARMSELHAALALESLDGLDTHLAHRRELASHYREGFAKVPGVRVQAIPATDTSTYKDLTVAIDDDFRISRDALVSALRAEGVQTRCYFDPPVHRQQSHADGTRLPVTDDVSSRVLSLPLHVGMSTTDVERLIEAVAALHAHAGPVCDAVA